MHGLCASVIENGVQPAKSVVDRLTVFVDLQAQGPSPKKSQSLDPSQVKSRRKLLTYFLTKSVLASCKPVTLLSRSSSPELTMIRDEYRDCSIQYLFTVYQSTTRDAIRRRQSHCE